MTLVTPDLGIIFWQTITFLVVLLILSKYAWHPILSALKERENLIAHGLHQVVEAKELMEKATCHRDALLGQANVTCERMVNEALKAQKKIIDQARSEGVKVKEELLAQAKVEISREEARSFQTLKANLGLLAVQMAEQLLVKELSQEKAQLELLKRLTVVEKQSLTQQSHA
ncbi:MAG: F0F1 ATP synthase subunit B [Amoebophilaceae bacterium]|nr:F0F1 ATP synthase subunit B [Amoebophilaceae bacterium]